MSTPPPDLIRAACRELTQLCPYLPAALARDTTAEPGPAAIHGTVTVVNADVLTAILTLEQEIPAAVLDACTATGEQWQHRDLGGCLRQLPRLAGRLHDHRLVAEEGRLAWQATGWVRTVKRALGLRKPDTPIGYDCPYTDTHPDLHRDGWELYAAGDEGSLRHGRDGAYVEWSSNPRIYCDGCAASWPYGEWTHLGNVLAGTTALCRGGWPTPCRSRSSPAASPPPSGPGRTAVSSPATAPTTGAAPSTTSRKPNASPPSWAVLAIVVTVCNTETSAGPCPRDGLPTPTGGKRIPPTRPRYATGHPGPAVTARPAANPPPGRGGPGTPRRATAMTSKYAALAVYYAECSRGIAHTPEWDAEMAVLHAEWDSLTETERLADMTHAALANPGQPIIRP